MSLLSDFKGDPAGKPKKAQAVESVKAKRALLRRAKRSERDFARWLITNDAPDDRYRNLTSSTGRIGHINQMRADCLSLHFLGENKNEKLPATIGKYWALINEKALEWGKSAILHWEPSNGGDFRVAGKKLPDLYIITGDRLAELLAKEKAYDARVD